MNFKKKVNGSWADTPHYIHKTDTDTFTTLPAVLYPTGSIATVGLKGNTVQSATPTPQNPVMPQGTGERTGNLAKYWKSAYITAAGLVNANRVNGASFPVKIEAGQTVSFTNQKTNFGRGIAIFSEFDGETLTNMLYRSTNNAVIYTADSDCYVIIWGNYDNTTSMDETVFNLCGQMLNSGSTPLPYEPYGYKLDIKSANTTTPVYLGEVETTRKIKKLVLTGEETFGYANSCFTYTFDGKPTSVQPIKAVIFSNAYEGIEPMYRDQLRNYQCCITRNFNQIAIRDDNYTDATDFKSYLAAQYAAGTPVTIWYVLAEPTTGIVNEPLRKIGEYADEVSNVATIPTITGKDTFDVDVTLKPSEVELTYTGWHDAQCKEYDGSQWV